MLDSKTTKLLLATAKAVLEINESLIQNTMRAVNSETVKEIRQLISTIEY